MKEPQYLVLTIDGVLHGYWTLSILLSALRTNPKDECVAIFKQIPALGTVRYARTTEAELRGMAA